MISFSQEEFGPRQGAGKGKAKSFQSQLNALREMDTKEAEKGKRRNDNGSDVEDADFVVT